MVLRAVGELPDARSSDCRDDNQRCLTVQTLVDKTNCSKTAEAVRQSRIVGNVAGSRLRNSRRCDVIECADGKPASRPAGIKRVNVSGLLMAPALPGEFGPVRDTGWDAISVGGRRNLPPV
jgi:hypothetical protein